MLKKASSGRAAMAACCNQRLYSKSECRAAVRMKAVSMHGSAVEDAGSNAVEGCSIRAACGAAVPTIADSVHGRQMWFSGDVMVHGTPEIGVLGPWLLVWDRLECFRLVCVPLQAGLVVPGGVLVRASYFGTRWNDSGPYGFSFRRGQLYQAVPCHQGFSFRWRVGWRRQQHAR